MAWSHCDAFAASKGSGGTGCLSNETFLDVEMLRIIKCFLLRLETLGCLMQRLQMNLYMKLQSDQHILRNVPAWTFVDMLDVAIMSSSIHFDVPLCSMFSEGSLGPRGFGGILNFTTSRHCVKKAGHISNFKRREKISWIFLSLKNRRVGEVRVGVPTCRQWNSRRDIISTPFQMIKTLIAQIEDQQSLAMNRSSKHHALDGRTHYFSKINHVNSTRIVVGQSSQNFLVTV